MKLWILDSTIWVSKSAELKGYLQNLESHKTSLALVVNTISWYYNLSTLTQRIYSNPSGNISQSTQNLENDAAELKEMMFRIQESNAAIAERMLILDSTPGGPRLHDGPQSKHCHTFYFRVFLTTHHRFPSMPSCLCLRRRSQPVVGLPTIFSEKASNRHTKVTQSWPIPPESACPEFRILLFTPCQ